MILVGRTGLDQLLRRDGSIELIRAKDTIDAIGELSDPIDMASPAQAAVLVAASIEPSDDELNTFIESLRVVDSSVRVLRVGSQRTPYDGCIDSLANLEQIIEAIERAQPQGEPISLRFVDASQAQPAAPATIEESKVENTPEIVVVAKNEDFEHRTQTSFEDESEIHKRVLTGSMVQDKPTLSGDSSADSEVSDVSLVSFIAPHRVVIDGPHDDLPLVQAMLAGQSVIDLAIERINTRLGRNDISFVTQSDDQTSIQGLPVMFGDSLAGKLACTDHAWAMGRGYHALVHQVQWLKGWIKLDIQQSELRNAAFTDSLTGAWNRRYFTRYLDAAIAQSRIARQPMTVMIFDIDGFKHYNDSYGHAAGDEILIETVKLLKSVIRPSDRVCRVGGDEFAVIFYEPKGPRGPESKPLESVYQIATRFQKQICQHRFPKLAGEAQGTLTVSAGLASFPWDGHDSESLLEQADQLAMESKRQGKNAITLGPGAESVCKTCD